MASKDDSTLKYSGDLAEPIRFNLPASRHVLGEDHPAVQDAMTQENWRIVGEITRKLDLLLDHHQIKADNPHKWELLVYRIAKEFIPGFRLAPPPSVGAPLDWGPVELAGLHIEVEALTKQGMSAMDACRLLLKADDGSWRYPRCRSVKTLYRRYQQSKRSLYVRLMTESNSERARESWRDSVMQALSESATDT